MDQDLYQILVRTRFAEELKKRCGGQLLTIPQIRTRLFTFPIQDTLWLIGNIHNLYKE